MGDPGTTPVAAVVLAAGTATRMGRNKLLCDLEGEPLIRRAVRAAGEAGLAPTLVVLGHEPDRAREALRGLSCEPILNPRFAQGINTSLGAGIAAVPADAGAAVVLLADMPFVTAAMVREVASRFRQTGAPLVASRYGEILAPPTLYARTLFPELSGGTGEGRGRQVVRRHRAEAAFVDWSPEALADIDAAADLTRARARLGRETASEKGDPG